MNQRKLQAMARRGLDVYLVTPLCVKDTLREIRLSVLTDADFKVFSVRSYWGRHNSLRVFHPGDLRKALVQINPDVVLLEQEPYSLSTYQVMREKRKFGFKTLLFTFQNLLKKYPPPFSIVESRNLKLADVLLAGNEDARSVWKKKGMPIEKIFVIPQVGIDFDEFFACDKVTAKSRLGVNGFVIGYAGRFVEEKGVQVLLEAMSHLKDLPLTLALAGKGPYRDDLESQIQAFALKNRVTFVEGLTHERMPEFMNSLDVLVLPSLARKHWREQFGHVLIEAMACGIPCVGTATDPIDAVIGDGGLTFPMGDAKQLAEHIRLMYTSPPTRERFSRQAIRRVEQHYTNDVIALQLEKIIRDLDKVRRDDTAAHP